MEPTFTLAELDEQTVVRLPEYGPLFAQALWMFGALLWGYVVLGEFVTTYGMPEVLALLSLLAILGFSALGALELPRRNRAPFSRKAGAVASALGLFGAIWLLTISFTSSAHIHPGAVSVALWFVAAFALFFGRNRARREQARKPPVLRDYFAWAACGLSTLFALLSAL
jgi:hypothetical protein